MQAVKATEADESLIAVPAPPVSPLKSLGVFDRETCGLFRVILRYRRRLVTAGSPKLLTIEETAELLRLSPRTVAAWSRGPRPRIPAVRLGDRVLFNVADLERWVQERTFRPIKSGDKLSSRIQTPVVERSGSKPREEKR